MLKFKTLEQLKTKALPRKKYIDYFFTRNKMIRWETQTNRFVEFNGLIDISFINKLILTPSEAKSQINLKNVNYLVRRKQLSEFYFNNINEPGVIWYVSAEDVKNRLTLLNEFHLVFDIKVEETPPFPFQTVFYGNIYDYLEMKNVEEKANN